MIVSLRRGRKSRKCASHAPCETHFFVLLMEHGRHIFEIDLTPVRYRHGCHLLDVLLVVLGADICYVYNWLKHSKHIG